MNESQSEIRLIRENKYTNRGMLITEKKADTSKMGRILRCFPRLKMKTVNTEKYGKNKHINV